VVDLVLIALTLWDLDKDIEFHGALPFSLIIASGSCLHFDRVASSSSTAPEDETIPCGAMLLRRTPAQIAFSLEKYLLYRQNDGMIVLLQESYAESCVEVVRTLPEWFGYPGALEDVGKATASQAGFVALDAGGETVGFVALQPNFHESLEITYLAIRADHRREGLGRALVKSVRDHALSTGSQSVCLLTLGPSADSEPYRATVAFYEAVGFWRTKELHLTNWGGAPTLLMVAPAASLG
jgi:GNAT superfamily N-acetyltransferase